MLLKNKTDIESWLNKYKIKNYELIPDDEYGYIVSVNDNVYLNSKNLKSIDVKFNEIDGNFYCNNNELSSLGGSPEIVKGYFDCGYNYLKSLNNSPKIINGNFNCSDNKLESLIGCPEIVNGSFDCSNNKLTSLHGCPRVVNKYFNCNKNKLNSLKGCPEIVNGDFWCNNNELNMEGLKYLINNEIKDNYINLNENKKLGELQKIDDFNEVKKILKIYQEKERLDGLMNKEIRNKSVVEKVKKI